MKDISDHSDRTLLNTINYIWRLLVTGFSFMLFGIGGAILSIVLYTISHLIPMSNNRKLSFIRSTISRTLGIYLLFLRLCGLLSYEIHGREHLRSNGQLIIANHPSLLDVAFVISLIRRTDCVIKSSLQRTPLTRGPVNTAKYISNDSKQLIQDCVDSLQQGNSLVIFPEGTRTRPGEALKFQRGVANVALMAEKNITPITIRCEPAALLKHQKWYQIPKLPPHYTIHVLPDIAIEPYLAMEAMQSQKARRLNRDLIDFFTVRINNPGH